MYRVSAWVAGADVGDADPVVTFCCRPHNPTGTLVELPSTRPLVVDEAYFEYAGVTAVDLLDDDVIVIRTFSKAFALASARVGYAVAARDTARELNERQAPAPISTLSAALALAGLEAGPPDVSETIAERERLAAALRDLGLEPLPSYTNFLLVPHEDAQELYESLLGRGVAVRPSPGAIRITVHRPEANARLVEALAAAVLPG
jgi:histidinol-phosphate aminotransferase